MAKSRFVVLFATPTGKRAKAITDAIVAVSTYTQKAGSTTYVIVCGFSLVYEPTSKTDRANAFDVQYLDDVITQWLSANGRGWKFEIRDVDGENPRKVTETKPKCRRKR